MLLQLRDMKDYKFGSCNRIMFVMLYYNIKRFSMHKTLFTLSALARCGAAIILLAVLWCGIYWAISLP